MQKFLLSAPLAFLLIILDWMRAQHSHVSHQLLGDKLSTHFVGKQTLLSNTSINKENTAIKTNK